MSRTDPEAETDRLAALAATATAPSPLSLALDGLAAALTGQPYRVAAADRRDPITRIQRPITGRWPDHPDRPPLPAGDGRVTVVIPTRDRPHLIGRALASVRGQTFPAWRCVVALNGPACESAEYGRVLAPFLADRAGRFAAIRAPGAAGIAGPINAALAGVTTEFAAVLDDDDAWAPTFLTRLATALAADRTLGLAYCDADHPGVDRDGVPRRHAAHPPMGGTFHAAQRAGNWFGWSQAVWRTAILRDTGGLAPAAAGCADRDAWLRIAAVAGVYHVAEPLAAHHWHAGNASSDGVFMGPGIAWIEAGVTAGRYAVAEPPLPSPGRQAVNFIGAVARHVAGGRQRASSEARAARLAACESCDQLRPSDRRCARCGCPIVNQVDSKVGWASESCPIGKWGREDGRDRHPGG